MFTCGAGSSAHAATGPLLKGIEFKITSDTEERVLFKLSGFLQPEVFGLEGDTPRVVCDFLGMKIDKQHVKNIISTKGKYIKNIRVGLHSSPVPKTRVVLDLTPDHNYDIEQMFFKEENLFVIVVHLVKEDKTDKKPGVGEPAVIPQPPA